MRTLAGILLLIIGVIFPMAMLFQMNSVLSRKPAPRPSRVGMLLALNGVLPVALIISGLMLLSDRFCGITGVARGADRDLGGVRWRCSSSW